MFRKSFYTFLNRFFIAILNFLTIVITARYLGAEGRGIISLFVLNLTIIFMIGSFIGGPGLVYLVPRHDATKLMNASYLWTVFSSVAVSLLLYVLGLVQQDFLIHLILLSVIQSVVRIQTFYLLAKERIKAYNFVSVIYPAVLFILLIYFFTVEKNAGIREFFIAFYAGSVITMLISSVLVYKNLSPAFSFDMKAIFSHAFKLGFVIQCANILQLLNYRFSFFLLDHYSGKHDVGIYSTAGSIAESVLIIANSFAVIQYSQIANSKNDDENAQLTIRISKVVLLLTFLATVVLLLFPQEIFTFIFGTEFRELKNLIPWLAPGILLYIFSITISHYYSGSGNPKMGLAGSAAGFVVTLVAGLLLIPEYNLKGAALTATLSYITTSLVLLIVFLKQKKLSLFDFIPDLKSLQSLKQNESRRNKN
ncbi:MAG TPA: polysaccharide biosynthesis C-terminal domain-containing protein [Bacteroidia bacterium]|nr:polysaccharide biosynthesis C-terminal domain-containing protein [Bacteroidia bacterium]